MMSSIFRAACAIMSLLFLFSVAVQYNDPDPLVWMAIYGVAAAVSLRAAGGRLEWRVPAVLAEVALIWALYLLPGVMGQTTLDEVTSSYRMGANPAAEEGRETGGLLIVTVWNVALAIGLRRRARGAAKLEARGVDQVRVG